MEKVHFVRTLNTTEQPLRYNGSALSDMVNKGLCSIIIPAYNCPADIAERCFSGFRDLNVPVEVLLMDDGSEEPYRNELMKAAEALPQLRYCRLEHHGVSAARNRGIEEAAGEYIVFCDIDDSIDADAFHAAYASLEDTVDILCCSYRKIRSGTESVIRHEEPFTLSSLLKNPTVYGTVWGKIYRRECLKQVRFREELSLAEDTAFLTELLLQHPAVQTADMPFYCHWLSDQSVSKKARDPLQEFFTSFAMIHSLLQNEPEEIRRLAGNCCIVNANVLMNYFVFNQENSTEKQKELFRRLTDDRTLQQSVSCYDPDFPAKYRLMAFLLRKKAFLPVRMIFSLYQRM